MNVFTVDGIECFSIPSNIIAGGTCNFNPHYNLFSQLIFESGERLNRVIACGTLSSFLESGNATEFFFEGDFDSSRIIGVRMENGRFVGLDHDAYRTARFKLNYGAWCYVAMGLVLLLIVIGLLFIWGAAQGFRVASMLKRASVASRLIETGEGKISYVRRDDDEPASMDSATPAYA